MWSLTSSNRDLICSKNWVQVFFQKFHCCPNTANNDKDRINIVLHQWAQSMCYPLMFKNVTHNHTIYACKRHASLYKGKKKISFKSILLMNWIIVSNFWCVRPFFSGPAPKKITQAPKKIIFLLQKNQILSIFWMNWTILSIKFFHTIFFFSDLYILKICKNCLFSGCSLRRLFSDVKK